MKIHKIEIPTPYAVGDVNAFLVKGDVLSIFDVGPRTKDALEAITKGIEEAGFTLKDVEQVILTHHHPDHSGWVEAFPNAEILGHPFNDYFLKKEKEYINYRKNFLEAQFQLAGVPIELWERNITSPKDNMLLGTKPLTQFLNEGDELPGHPGFKCYYTPGHAQSHLIFVNEESGVAIGGDLLLEKITPNPIIETPLDLSMNRPKYFVLYRESLKRLKSFNVKTLFTGHGADLENVNEFIDMRLKRDHIRAMQVFELLDEPKSLMDVTKVFYDGIYEKQLGLTLSKTLGYLDFLESENFISVEKNGDVLLYQKK